jgi:hypothetical protein
MEVKDETKKFPKREEEELEWRRRLEELEEIEIISIEEKTKSATE